MTATPQPGRPIRYSWGGDEFLFIEVDEEMSLRANLRAAALARRLTDAAIHGVTDICPSNASLLVRFNPDIVAPPALLESVQGLERQAAEHEGGTMRTRIIEVPVWYDDPHTGEVGARFRANHQTPEQSDLDFAAAENGLAGREAFIAAHSSSPWIVTMVGFVAGLPFLYQMVDRAEQLQVPKYLSPRTDTPALTVGHGGCFTAIYSVRGAGGYQMFGLAAAPIYEPEQTLPDFAESIVLFRPGDVVVFTPIDAERYERIQAQVAAGEFRYRIIPFELDTARAVAEPRAYNTELMEAVRGH